VFCGWPCRDQMWVPTQEMRYSATSACFQAGPILRIAEGKEVSNEPELRPSEGVGGKGRAKTLPNICLSWVHSSAAELPSPKLTQDVRGIWTHLQVFQDQSLGLCAGNSAHSSNLTYLSSEIASCRTQRAGG